MNWPSFLADGKTVVFRNPVEPARCRPGVTPCFTICEYLTNRETRGDWTLAPQPAQTLNTAWDDYYSCVFPPFGEFVWYAPFNNDPFASLNASHALVSDTIYNNPDPTIACSTARLADGMNDIPMSSTTKRFGCIPGQGVDCGSTETQDYTGNLESYIPTLATSSFLYEREPTSLTVREDRQTWFRLDASFGMLGCMGADATYNPQTRECDCALGDPINCVFPDCSHGYMFINASLYFVVPPTHTPCEMLQEILPLDFKNWFSSPEYPEIQRQVPEPIPGVLGYPIPNLPVGEGYGVGAATCYHSTGANIEAQGYIHTRRKITLNPYEETMEDILFPETTLFTLTA